MHQLTEMQTKSKLLLIVFIFVFNDLAGQIGGRHFYEFLVVSNSARITALGGSAIAVKDADATLAFFNPSALNASMHQRISFAHNFYLGDLQNGYFSYAHHLGESDYTLHGAIHYMSYGEFEAADIYGDRQGTFKASEQAYTVGVSKQLNENYSVGTNLKLVNSGFESYSSFGVSGDLAFMFHNPVSQTTASLVLNNIGSPLTYYTEDESGKLPFNVMLGFSKRLKHLPFRYSIIAHHLDEWNIAYDNPDDRETQLFLGEETQTDDGASFADILFRHFIFNGEFLFGKSESFKVRLGYNHLRRAELKLNDVFTISGFSFGVGFKVSKIFIDYGYSSYHLAAGAHHFTLSTSIQDFKKPVRVE